MKLLLYLGLTKKQYWQRTAQGWQALNEKPSPDKPVWVVTNLSEEGFVEVEIPRVFGQDRQSLLQRQLMTHFPETDYRTRLKLTHGTQLLDKLAPTHHTLFGITNAKKIDDILNEEDIQLAALSSASLLLAQTGRHKALPKTLFVVLSDTESLRIVFIKNHIPCLTRLAAIPDREEGRVDAQIEEIIRTQRYLENTRALEKGHALPVLLLGDATECSAPLAQAGFSIVASPLPRGTTPPANGWHPLFDLAIQKHTDGQLAPMARRTRYLASRIRRQAWITSACLVLSGIAIASLHINGMQSILHEQKQTASTIATLNRQHTELDHQASAFGASSDLIRRALALDTHEMLEAPSFEHQLTQIAQTLDKATHTTVAGQSIRLSLLKWAIVSPNTAPCADNRTSPSKEASNTTAPATPDTPNASATSPLASDSSPPQQAQISFDLVLPSGLTQRSRLDMIRNISTHLKDLPDIQIFEDPYVGLSHATLKGGAQTSTDETPVRWCITLPGQTLPTESPTP